MYFQDPVSCPGLLQKIQKKGEVLLNMGKQQKGATQGAAGMEEEPLAYRQLQLE